MFAVRVGQLENTGCFQKCSKAFYDAFWSTVVFFQIPPLWTLGSSRSSRNSWRLRLKMDAWFVSYHWLMQKILENRWLLCAWNVEDISSFIIFLWPYILSHSLCKNSQNMSAICPSRRNDRIHSKYGRS